MKKDPETFNLLMKSHGWKKLSDLNIPRSLSSNNTYFLNGFTAYFRNYYIVVEGRMPLSDAQYIYNNNDKSLEIRVNGHGNHVAPTFKNSENDIVNDFGSRYIEEVGLTQAIKGGFDKKCLELSDKLIKENPESFYIDCYHVDTWKGFEVLSKYIKHNNIKTKWFEE